MRCRDAKQQLTAQRETELARSEVLQVQEHLEQCSDCHSFDLRQAQLDSKLEPSPPRVYSSISTERIMQAIEQQKRISQQLEHIQAQQQARLARMGKAGPKIAGMIALCTGVLTVGLLFLFLFQPDLLLTVLSALSGVFTVIYTLAQYLLAGLMLITSQNWVLSAVALGIVVMMGMWLRLMRYPGEA
ncbi:MAG TPA: zf-HC2 domain-containing protein [Ktedonobacteraceae bacterium]|nr:zf-HC2 domain-containing protein [Ktedonobacteraceae bacterium]